MTLRNVLLTLIEVSSVITILIVMVSLFVRKPKFYTQKDDRPFQRDAPADINTLSGMFSMVLQTLGWRGAAIALLLGALNVAHAMKSGDTFWTALFHMGDVLCSGC